VADEPRRRPRLPAVKMGRGINAAWEAALSIVLGAVLGIYADRWLDTSPWLMIVFLTLGAIVAFRRLIAFGRRAAKDEETPPR
jgi:F0F1-type ATP synthase assembly protein I